MRIKNSNEFAPAAFFLTSTVLREAARVAPYKMTLADLTTDRPHSSVPYEMVGYTSTDRVDGKYLADVVITRDSRNRVTEIKIGCQYFKGKTALLIVKAAVAARAKAKSKKKSTKKSTKKSK